MSPKIAAVGVALALLAGAAGLCVQSGRAFQARADQAAAALTELRQAGVDATTLDGLARQLQAIRQDRLGPVPRAWLPGPLGAQGARFQALLGAIETTQRAALATGRRDASAALQQLAAADPGLPAAEVAAYRARIDGATTPLQLRRLTGELQAASATATRQRRPALDLEPKVAGLRRLMATAADLQVDSGQAAAAVAAYEALVKLPAREVPAQVAAVSGLLDQATTSLSSAVEKAQQERSGPPVPPAPSQQGRVVVIDLGDQQLYAYQDGAPFVSAPVTTGRPELPTDQGTFHVIFKRSPYEFISPWPRSSPYYYPPAWTNWAVEFVGDGTFLHDAPWQPDGTYGPGSQNGPYASHGCVHVPGGVMPTLYSWLQPGDTVIVRP